MDDLETLITEKKHEKILAFEGENFAKYKVIAALFLNKFEEALKYAEKNSFEMAYAYYRLKKYKKALSIVRQQKTKEFEILKAQCLYYLGYYAEAYNIIARYGTNNEHAVNLKAIESMESLSKRNKYKLSYFSVQHHGNINKIVKYVYKNPECLMEAKYNEIYEKIDNENEYLDLLYQEAQNYNLENNIFEKQIKVIRGENVNPNNFNARENEIIDLNNGKITKLANPVHFQKNFEKSKQKNILIDLAIKENLYGGEFMTDCEWRNKILQCGTEGDRILKCFSYIKNGGNKSELVKKWLVKCDDSIEKEILLLLSSDLFEKANMEKAVEIILKYNK